MKTMKIFMSKNMAKNKPRNINAVDWFCCLLALKIAKKEGWLNDS